MSQKTFITPAGGQEWRFLIGGLFLSDMLAVGLATLVAALVRYGEASLPKGYQQPWQQAALLALWIGLFWALGWRNGIYSPERLLGGPAEYERVARTAVYTAVLEMILGFLLVLPDLSRAWWVTLLLSGTFFACLARFGIRRVAYYLRRKHGLFVTRVLIAGANDQGVDIARQLLWSPDSGYRVAGFVDDYLPAGARLKLYRPGDPRSETERWMLEGSAEVLGCSSQLGPIAAKHGARVAIVIPEAIAWEGLQEIVSTYSDGGRGLKVHLSTSLYDIVTSGLRPAQMAMIPLLAFDPMRLAGLDALLKNSFDRVAGFLLLLALFPTGLGMVVAARLRGVWPALEWRTVLGRGGRRVRMPLFRRSVAGRVLLRGIPALLCVVLGQLSLVGPRPIPAEEAAKYGRWEQLLGTMRPGLTGYWRLLPEAATLEETAAWDLWYLRNYSIWTDLFLLFKTGWLAFGKRGQVSYSALRRWGSSASIVKPKNGSA